MKRGQITGTQLAFDLDGWQSASQQAAPRAEDQEELDCEGYDLGHPWHYLERGGAGIPIPVEKLLPPSPSPHDAPLKLPANPKKRLARLRDNYQKEQRCLADSKARYEQILEEGVDALSCHDRQIHGGDLELAWACSVALAYNHIVSCLGRLAWLRRELGIDSAV